MKKVAVFFLALVIVAALLAMAGCGGSDNSANNAQFTGIWTDAQVTPTGSSGYVQGSSTLRIVPDGTWGILFNWNENGQTKEYSVDGNYQIKDANTIYLDDSDSFQDRFPSPDMKTMTLGKDGDILILKSPVSTLNKVSNWDK